MQKEIKIWCYTNCHITSQDKCYNFFFYCELFTKQMKCMWE